MKDHQEFINKDPSTRLQQTPNHGAMIDLDSLELLKLGKKPVLKRNFGLLSTIGFVCIIMFTWEACLTYFPNQFFNGGYAGCLYGYLIVWIGTICVFATMGELASMAPTAGGQYHWVAMLAPPQCRKFASYIIGWLTVFTWQAIVISGALLGSIMIQTLVVAREPTFNFAPWQGAFIFWALVIWSLFFNTIISRFLPQLEWLLLVLHTICCFTILVPLLYWAPKTDSVTVFTEFINGGRWPSETISFLVGIIWPVIGFLGAESAVHMSEEIVNSSRNVPRAMMSSIVLNGALGLATTISILYCIGNPNQILEKSNYPFIPMFQQAVGNNLGAITMSAIVSIIFMFALFGMMTTASRVTWSFARDHGIPFSKHLSIVEKRTELPMNSITLTALVSFLLGFINFGSTEVLSAACSIILNGCYTSFIVCNTLLLYRRLSGHIKPWRENQGELTNTTSAKLLTWGPWKITEPYGTLVNCVGIVYMTIILIFSFFPLIPNPRPSRMNWSCLSTGSVIILATIYYHFSGRKTYSGPVIEDAHDLDRNAVV